ncbi:MAG: sugar phosphate isomerase/epimerase [Hyphomonadaceae bacterium]
MHPFDIENQLPDLSAATRRIFLKGMCAAGASVPLAACNTTAGESGAGPFFSNHDLPIGIQLYMLGDLARTDLDGTLNEVSGIGYRAVELAGYLGKTPQELRASFDRAGVVCTSAHVGLRAGTAQEPGLTGDLDQLAADMKAIGAGHVVCPILTPPSDIKVEPKEGEGFRVLTRMVALMTEDHWKRLAAQLNQIGGALKARGLSFGYHNHNVEFAKIGDRTGFDILIAETDPDLVDFELDIGWAAAAGYDPAKVFEKHSGRFGLAHVKDVKATTQPNVDLRMDPTEIGSGRLDWTRIIPAAYKAGVRKFFVEQEPPFAIPRIEAAAKNFAFLNQLQA